MSSKGLLARAVAGALLAVALAAGAQTALPTLQVDHLVYAISVNGQPAGDAVLLRLDGKRLLARAADWDRWHLKHPAQQYTYEDDTYYDLADAPGFDAKLDAQKQEAQLAFATAAFTGATVSLMPSRKVTPQLPPGLGGFFNYEVVGTHTAPDNAAAWTEVGSQVEAGLFNPLGVATSSWVGLNLGDEAAPGLEPRRVVRLNTTLTHDDPEDMETLELGDTVGTAGLWGRPVRFGGVRWGRNFGTQPGFVTVPQPQLSGSTSLPSALDVYVDGMRRSSLQVPPGPFTIDALPTVSGEGDVQVVVRDLLGREQVITEPYIAGVQQLKPGLHDFSLEAGAVRENFGLESNDYGRFVATGTERYGFNDYLTGEARLEVDGGEAQTAGLGAVVAIPHFAVVSNAFAVSHGDRGYGTLDVVTLQKNFHRTLSLGARLQYASTQFTQVGLLPGTSPPLRSFAGNFGWFFLPRTRLGVAYVNRKEAAPLPDFEATTVSITSGLRFFTVSLLGIERTAPTPDWSVGVNLSLLFGQRDSATAGYRYHEDDAGTWGSEAYARAQRNLPEQEGWGYRVMVTQDQSALTDPVTGAEAGVGLNGTYGSYGLEASKFDAATAYRGTVTGGLGALGGHVFASRELSRSFAIVEAGAGDITLLVNNRPAATTNSDGVAVLPYLQPYQDNVVRIDASDVPLDVDVRSGEIDTAPYYRSGVLLPLDARRARSAVVTLALADGSPVPAGSIARLAGAEYPVGRKGETFVSQLQPGENVLDVSWDGGRHCRATFTLPADAGVQPRLGPVTCQETR